MEHFNNFVEQIEELEERATELQIENTELKTHLTASLTTIEMLQRQKIKDENLLEELEYKLHQNYSTTHYMQGVIFAVFAVAIVLIVFMVEQA